MSVFRSIMSRVSAIAAKSASAIPATTARKSGRGCRTSLFAVCFRRCFPGGLDFGSVRRCGTGDAKRVAGFSVITRFRKARRIGEGVSRLKWRVLFRARLRTGGRGS